jgi:hypothetical protein
MIRTRESAGIREFLENDRKQERERQQAKERAERAPENERLSRFWSQQWDDLKGYAKVSAAKDKYFSTAAISASDKQSDAKLQSTAFDAFIENAGKQGLTLSDDAQQRLALFAIVQGWSQGIVFTQVSNWSDAFARLKELQVFQDGDIVQQAVPVPAQKPIDALSLISTQSREGRREAIKITEERWLQEECAPLFRSWIQSLYDYDAWRFVPSESQRQAALAQAAVLGLNLSDWRVYDRLRLHLGRNGHFPLLQTPEEKLCEDLEQFKRDNPTATARDERAFLQQKKNERMG